jgi:Domain of unknown function (DUF4416)
MANPRPPAPVMLVVAAFSRYAAALDWGRDHLERAYGPVALTLSPFDFHHTAYYEPAMGPGLRKCLFAFRDLVPADSLPAVKQHTNGLETELAATAAYPEPRPLNLDPGLLSLGKFLLATTKDQAHRIYLRDGIFAEVTLRFEAGAFEPWPWTYADYREPAVRGFLRAARDYYRQRLRECETPGGGGERCGP